MSGSSGSKAPSVPEWQLATPSSQPTDPLADQKASVTSPPPASRDALVEQASRFLEDESIRDAPTDKKVAFLESKGLQNDEIQRAMGVSRNMEAAPTTQHSPASATDTAEPSSPQSEPSTSLQPPQTPPSPPRDIPPVITYPEFLLHPSQPPPLITAGRLAYTLYLTSGLAAAFYGTSKYLVAPMFESLTSSRHDLAQTAQANLQKLNEKLSANVSKIPSASSPIPHATEQADTEDAESIISDPTELFHRDIATQTTPTLTRSASSSSTTSTFASQAFPLHDTITSHAQRLNIIHSRLSEFTSSENASITSLERHNDLIAELHTYLDGLTYGGAPPGYVNGIYTTMYGGGYEGLGSAAAGQTGEEDAISKFKVEIRGVKGALLNAKNFPSGPSRRMR